MKKTLSPGAIAAVLALVGVVLAIIGFLVFKPSLGPGPLVKPIPFKPPGGAVRNFGGIGPKGAPATKPN